MAKSSNSDKSRFSCVEKTTRVVVGLSLLIAGPAVLAILLKELNKEL